MRADRLKSNWPFGSPCRLWRSGKSFWNLPWPCLLITYLSSVLLASTLGYNYCCTDEEAPLFMEYVWSLIENILLQYLGNIRWWPCIIVMVLNRAQNPAIKVRQKPAPKSWEVAVKNNLTSYSRLQHWICQSTKASAAKGRGVLSRVPHLNRRGPTMTSLLLRDSPKLEKVRILGRFNFREACWLSKFVDF